MLKAIGLPLFLALAAGEAIQIRGPQTILWAAPAILFAAMSIAWAAESAQFFIAQGFALEWIWFEESPQEETAVERARFAAYGYPVRAGNLRSDKLRGLMRPQGDLLAFGSFSERERWIPEVLARCWLRARANGAG